MNRRNVAIIGCVAASVVVGTVGAMVTQDNLPRRITRVERPVFAEKDWDGIYFEDLFEQGLVGERPAPASGQIASDSETGSIPGTTAVEGDTLQPDTGSAVSEDGIAWSKVIGKEVLEDEIKALQQTLTRDVTTPVKFKSDYRKARQSYSILSLLFAIIRTYDSDDVRWKDSAPHAQAAFERAAANARVGSEQSYQSAKSRLEELSGLLRGESFSGQETPVEEIDWGRVVDRTPIMKRLEAAKDTIKPLLASSSEFLSNSEIVLHEASLIAAMGYVLGDENSDDGDDEGYAEFATNMSAAATALVESTRAGNYDEASAAFGLIDNSCQDCHADWR